MTHHTRDERASGYVTSGLIFAGITALWALIVRGDEFYSTVNIAGVNLPATTIFYLLAMPALGLLAGMWRYRDTGGFFLGKLVARFLHFTYSHLLIVLFTAAMVTDYFLAWNIDAAVQEIDDGLFDVASRFAPWLSAYLAGFNFGRALGLRGGRRLEPAADAGPSIFAAPEEEDAARARREPSFAPEAAATTPAPDNAIDPAFNRPIPNFSRLR